MRKKVCTLILVLILVLCLNAGIAAGTNVTVAMDPTITLEYNGYPWVAQASTGKVIYPFLYTVNSTQNTYLPLRAICELAGLEVGYIQSTKTITLKTNVNYTAPIKGDDMTPYFTKVNVTGEVASDFTILFNGKYYIPRNPEGEKMDPIIINGTTYLPLRAIAELAGLSVVWHGADRSISLTNARDDSLQYVDSGECPSVITYKSWYNLLGITGQTGRYEGYGIQIPHIYSESPGATYINNSLIDQSYADAIQIASNKTAKTANYSLQISYKTGGVDTLAIIVEKKENTWGKNWKDSVRIYHYDYINDSPISGAQLLEKYGITGEQIINKLISTVGIYDEGGQGKDNMPPVQQSWLDEVGTNAKNLNLYFTTEGLVLYYVGQDASGEILSEAILNF